MTGPGAGGEPGSVTAQWMAELGSALTAAGLRMRVNSTCGVLDLTAEVPVPQGKPAEVIADKDSYTEVGSGTGPVRRPPRSRP